DVRVAVQDDARETVLDVICVGVGSVVLDVAVVVVGEGDRGQASAAGGQVFVGLIMCARLRQGSPVLANGVLSPIPERVQGPLLPLFQVRVAGVRGDVGVAGVERATLEIGQA